MNVVDSSGWLEFFADGPNADASRMLVPPDNLPDFIPCTDYNTNTRRT